MLCFYREMRILVAITILYTYNITLVNHIMCVYKVRMCMCMCICKCVTVYV